MICSWRSGLVPDFQRCSAWSRLLRLGFARCSPANQGSISNSARVFRRRRPCEARLTSKKDTRELRGEPPIDPTSPPRSAAWIVICGGASWLAVVLLGWVDPIDASSQSASARWYLLGISWCLTIVFGAPLWRSVGGPPASAFGAAALAISVNLLAAGGISMPAVALSLWILIALGLNLREDLGCGKLREYAGRTFPFLGGVVAAILLGLSYRDVTPYLRSQTLIGRARDQISREKPDFDRARTAYFNAISADPYDVTPWYGLADLEFQYWLSRGAKAGEPIWKEVDIALLKALDAPRDPRTLGVQLQRAGYAREILARRGADLTPLEIVKLRGTIVNAMRNATISHPTNALYHGELAEASAELGEYSGAVKAAKECSGSTKRPSTSTANCP